MLYLCEETHANLQNAFSLYPALETCRNKRHKQIFFSCYGVCVVSFSPLMYNYIPRGVWVASNCMSKAMQRVHLLTTVAWCRNINLAPLSIAESSVVSVSVQSGSCIPSVQKGTWSPSVLCSFNQHKSADSQNPLILNTHKHGGLE